MTLVGISIKCVKEIGEFNPLNSMLTLPALTLSNKGLKNSSLESISDEEVKKTVHGMHNAQAVRGGVRTCITGEGGVQG